MSLHDDIRWALRNCICLHTGARVSNGPMTPEMATKAAKTIFERSARARQAIDTERNEKMQSVCDNVTYSKGV